MDVAFRRDRPRGGDFSSTARVPLFFQAIDDNVEVLGFEQTESVSEGDTVVSLGTFSCRANTTGKSATTKWVFIWKFRDGRVVSYEQFHDGSIADIFKS